MVTLGQPRLEVVGLGCWKPEKTNFLEWQRKACSVERMEMFFSSKVDSVRREPSGEVPGSILGVKTEKCFTNILKQQSFCRNRSPSSSLTLALLENASEMLKDDETIN